MLDEADRILQLWLVAVSADEEPAEDIVLNIVREEMSDDYNPSSIAGTNRHRGDEDPPLWKIGGLGPILDRIHYLKNPFPLAQIGEETLEMVSVLLYIDRHMRCLTARA